MHLVALPDPVIYKGWREWASAFLTRLQATPEDTTLTANKIQLFGPMVVPNAIGDLIAPAAAGAGAVGYTATATYIILKHVRIINTTGIARTFSGYIGVSGGSAAGTEFIGTGLSIGPNSVYDWTGQVRLQGANGFFTGVASAAAALTLEGEGEIGLV